jgi:cytolysin-activating lysine-acyltransferase
VSGGWRLTLWQEVERQTEQDGDEKVTNATGQGQNGATAHPASFGPKSNAPPPPAPAPVTPELMAQISEMRAKIQMSIGQTVLAIMDLPRYRHMSLGDLSHLVINPLLRNRVAIAHKSVVENGVSRVDEEAIAGIAIWASVSPAVDAKISEQTKSGIFPLRLAPEDWTSGDLPWLIDVIAGDRQQATAVLANFRQLVGDKAIKIHPMVARLIDPAVLEKLRVASAGEGPNPEETAQ